MNVESSRSHAIFSITVESSEMDDKGEEHVKMGKLQLVDLAVICLNFTEFRTKIIYFSSCRGLKDKVKLRLLESGSKRRRKLICLCRCWEMSSAHWWTARVPTFRTETQN